MCAVCRVSGGALHPFSRSALAQVHNIIRYARREFSGASPALIQRREGSREKGDGRKLRPPTSTPRAPTPFPVPHRSVDHPGLSSLWRDEALSSTTLAVEARPATRILETLLEGAGEETANGDRDAAVSARSFPTKFKFALQELIAVEQRDGEQKKKNRETDQNPKLEREKEGGEDEASLSPSTGLDRDRRLFLEALGHLHRHIGFARPSGDAKRRSHPDTPPSDLAHIARSLAKLAKSPLMPVPRQMREDLSVLSTVSRPLFQELAHAPPDSRLSILLPLILRDLGRSLANSLPGTSLQFPSLSASPSSLPPTVREGPLQPSDIAMWLWVIGRMADLAAPSSYGRARAGGGNAKAIPSFSLLWEVVRDSGPVVEAAGTQAAALSPVELSETAWALGKMELLCRRKLLSLSSSSAGRKDSRGGDPVERRSAVSGMLQKIGRTGRLLFEETAVRLESLGPEGSGLRGPLLCDLMWSAGRLKEAILDGEKSGKEEKEDVGGWDSRRFVRCVTRAVGPVVEEEELSARAVANVLWGLGKLGELADPSLLWGLQEVSVRFFPEWSAQDLSASAVAFGRMNSLQRDGRKAKRQKSGLRKGRRQTGGDGIGETEGLERERSKKMWNDGGRLAHWCRHLCREAMDRERLGEFDGDQTVNLISSLASLAPSCGSDRTTNSLLLLDHAEVRDFLLTVADRLTGTSTMPSAGGDTPTTSLPSTVPHSRRPAKSRGPPSPDLSSLTNFAFQNCVWAFAALGVEGEPLMAFRESAAADAGRRVGGGMKTTDLITLLWSFGMFSVDAEKFVDGAATQLLGLRRQCVGERGRGGQSGRRELDMLNVRQLEIILWSLSRQSGSLSAEAEELADNVGRLLNERLFGSAVHEEIEGGGKAESRVGREREKDNLETLPNLLWSLANLSARLTTQATASSSSSSSSCVSLPKSLENLTDSIVAFLLDSSHPSSAPALCTDRESTSKVASALSKMGRLDAPIIIKLLEMVDRREEREKRRGEENAEGTDRVKENEHALNGSSCFSFSPSLTVSSSKLDLTPWTPLPREAFLPFSASAESDFMDSLSGREGLAELPSDQISPGTKESVWHFEEEARENNCKRDGKEAAELQQKEEIEGDPEREAVRVAMEERMKKSKETPRVIAETPAFAVFFKPARWVVLPSEADGTVEQGGKEAEVRSDTERDGHEVQDAAAHRGGTERREKGRQQKGRRFFRETADDLKRAVQSSSVSREELEERAAALVSSHRPECLHEFIGCKWSLELPFLLERRWDFGVCHRLDAETSGPLLVAKSPKEWARLRLLFDAALVDKEYLCLVHGRAPEGTHRIDKSLSIGRDVYKRTSFAHVSTDGRAKEASTIFRCVARFVHPWTQSESTAASAENGFTSASSRKASNDHSDNVHGRRRDRQWNREALRKSAGHGHTDSLKMGVDPEDSPESSSDVLPSNEFQEQQGERRDLPHQEKDSDVRHYSLLQVRTLTGRTHQIRAHLSDFGLPLVSDYKYLHSEGLKKDAQWCPRLFLHSWRLSFPCPSPHTTTLRSPSCVETQPDGDDSSEGERLGIRRGQESSHDQWSSAEEIGKEGGKEKKVTGFSVRGCAAKQSKFSARTLGENDCLSRFSVECPLPADLQTALQSLVKSDNN